LVWQLADKVRGWAVCLGWFGLDARDAVRCTTLVAVSVIGGSLVESETRRDVEMKNVVLATTSTTAREQPSVTVISCQRRRTDEGYGLIWALCMRETYDHIAVSVIGNDGTK
jgi:hypothetical protein